MGIPTQSAFLDTPLLTVRMHRRVHFEASARAIDRIAAGTASMHKCMKCPNPATLHITEVLGASKFEELHFCENCAHKYLNDPQPAKAGKTEAVAEGEEGLFGQAECPHCGIKFVEF